MAFYRQAGGQPGARWQSWTRALPGSGYGEPWDMQVCRVKRPGLMSAATAVTSPAASPFADRGYTSLATLSASLIYRFHVVVGLPA